MSRPGERSRGDEDHGKRQSSSLANGGTENSSAEKRREHHWRSYKLIIDPALRKGSHKLYRYDGQHFNIPNPGIPPVDMVRDPRIGRLWTRYRETDLPVPKFKIDECYIGRVPPKEVTFARLNDNIREGFLTDMCQKYGEIEEVEILYNPKNKKHLGIAKVVFGSVKAAKDAVQNLHNTSVMGNIIHAELDPKGENRLRYVQRLINGSFTPLTVPVGDEEPCEVSPRSLAEVLLSSCEPLRRLSESGSTSTSTPLSMDTAYSSLRQDATPQSQTTPITPRPSGTPFSQDSAYSGRQATPTFQRSRRHETKFQDAYNRRPERHYVHGGYRGNAEKPNPPPEAPPPPVTPNFKPAFSPYQPPMPPVYPPAEPHFHQSDYRHPPPQAPPPTTPEFHPEPPPMPEEARPATPTSCPSPSPGTPTLEAERHSLDSRIEMLLKEKRTKLPFLSEGGDSDGEVRMEGSPISSSSSQLSPIPPSSAALRTARPPSTGLEDISPTPLPDSDDDEPIPGTASAMHHPQSTSPSNTHNVGGPHTPTDKVDTGNQSSGEDMEISDDEMPGTPISSDCAKGIVVNSAVSPITPQSMPLPPPGFPPLPPPQPAYAMHLPPHLPAPPPMLPPMPPYPPGMMAMVPVELMSCLPQWGSVHMSFQMQTQMLSRMAQSQRAYPYPQFLGGTTTASTGAMQFGGPYQPLSMVGTPSGGHGQPWPLPTMPKFNPSVPPPGYEPKKEDPHKATVDGVLMVIVKELKAIMKRDLNRKMVEVVAFRAFDEWWERKERSAKATSTPVKTGEGKEDDKERVKPKEMLSSSLLETWGKGEGLGYEGMGLGIGLRGAIRLPSFKVKRKEPPDPVSTGESKRARPSTPVDDELEDEESERADAPSDGTRVDDASFTKRRHARPVELDSEGEEEEDEEEEETGREESSVSDREDEADVDVSERLSSSKEAEKDNDDDDEDGSQSESESSSSDSSDEGATSSSSSQSDSDSSESDSSSEYESSSDEREDEEEEEEKEKKAHEVAMDTEDEDKEVVPSSSSSSSSSPSSSSEDEEEAEMKAPSTPAAPVEEESEVVRLEAEEAVHAVTAAQDNLRRLSPKGIKAEESDIDLEVRKMEPHLEGVGTLRPPTPPHAEEEEIPRTPGRDVPAPSEADTPTIHLPLPPAHSVLPPPRLSSDEDIPRTPGRDLPHRLSKSQSSETAPATPTIPATPSTPSEAPPTGSSLSLSSPFPYPLPSTGIPPTPGRDLNFTPVFPDSPAALPLHRKSSSEKPLFKEPGSATSCSSSPLPVVPASCLDAATVPTNQHVPLIELSVPDDSASGKKKPGRPRKPAVVEPEDAQEPPEAMMLLPPDLPVKDLLPECEALPGVLRGADGSAALAQKEKEEKAEEKHEEIKQDIKEEVKQTVPFEEPLQKTRGQRRSWEELLLSMHLPVKSPPRRSFLPRSEFEEMTILYDIWNEGIDEEDVRYLKITYEKMLQQDNAHDWLNDTLWVPHPPTSSGSLPGGKKKRREDGMRDHVTGCARSEGYYKIDKKDKVKYLNSTRLQSDEPDKDMQGRMIPAQPHASTRAGSERRSEQRRLLSSFSCDSDLLKFNQLKFRKKKIRFCKSHIHDWGLFAMEPIAADEMVIEYVGQNIRQVIADMREKRYEEEGIGSSYMFRVDHDTIIDATKCGNFARFINHSCNPNCYAKVITVESQKKIVIYSRQPINVNEEITYDYKFPIEDEKIPCLCGAENCRGTLN
ncbi:histone-lysine N-methyltransferase SETD1B-A isoform X1 [Pangasianodon hypophthalmus]|uniref:histone-lysine N-methyltransferase SETD1B-A isoform X1 n=1 Tax=Pangasianodon hypophthalmus TaxID=310915 RepID=UPI0023082C83|nr:histone-lysine N-methyltransferase SETD1B-A isoform X1 [Pangasianodon hypophthalmus]